MTKVLISEKGQLTIPATIRRKANLHRGSAVDVELEDGKIVVTPMKSLLELKGALKQYAAGKTTDLNEIREQALAEMAREKVEKMAREDADVENC